MLEKGKHLEIYNIGTDAEVTIAELAKLVGKAFGREIKIQPGEALAGGTPRRCPDVSKLRALGYEPKVSLESGVKDTASWYNLNSSLAPAKNLAVK